MNRWSLLAYRCLLALLVYEDIIRAISCGFALRQRLYIYINFDVFIGKLSAKIPWSNIYTQPVVVAIEDVFVLASPVTGKILAALKVEKQP